MATKIKRLAVRGIVPSKEVYSISFIEAYTRMSQFDSEMNHTIEEIRRYRAHLTLDISVLNKALETSDSCYTFLIGKKIEELQKELQILDESAVGAEDPDEDDSSSIYVSSCDACSIDS
jgi:hypothetical protein